MSEQDKPSGKVIDLPGMAVVVVPVEVAEKIGDFVSQILEGESDTSGYMFRGVGQISARVGSLSVWQTTPTGNTTITSCTIIGIDDHKTADSDAIEYG